MRRLSFVLTALVALVAPVSAHAGEGAWSVLLGDRANPVGDFSVADDLRMVAVSKDAFWFLASPSGKPAKRESPGAVTAAFDLWRPNGIFAVGGGNLLYAPSFGFTDWANVTPTGVPAGSALARLQVSSTDFRVLLGIANPGGRLVRSADTGGSWAPVDIGGPADEFLRVPTSGLIAVRSGDGIAFASDVASTTWTRRAIPAPSGGSFAVKAVALGAGSPFAVFASNGLTLRSSKDGGATFAPSGALSAAIPGIGVGAATVSALSGSMSKADLVLAAVGDQVAYSYDAGANWGTLTGVAPGALARLQLREVSGWDILGLTKDGIFAHIHLGTEPPFMTGEAALDRVAGVGSAPSCTPPANAARVESAAVTWFADGKSITPRPGVPFVVPGSASGRALSCRIIATNSAGKMTIASKSVRLAFKLGTPRVAVTGRPRPGKWLRCVPGTPKGGTVPVYSYAWLRNGKVVRSARRSTLRISSFDVGRRIACQVAIPRQSNKIANTSKSVTIVR